MSARNIVITGVAGFIGSHLADRLIEKGFIVHGIDNFDPFYARDLKESNLSTLKKSETFKFIELDLRLHKKVNETLSFIKPDIIIHLAAKAGVNPSFIAPTSYVSSNVEMTTNLLEAAVKNKCERFILASSSSVYGNSSGIPFNPDEKNLHPISPYGATKLACEHMAYVYAKAYQLPCFALRFFTVFGPRQRPDLAIHKFFSQISRGEKIELYGDGSTSRDYTYIDDIISGIEATLITDSPSSEIPFKVYNLGSHHPISLKNLVTSIEEVIGKKAQISFRPDRMGDVTRTYADISKSTLELNYHPRTSFEEGLRKFWSWYKTTNFI